MKSPFDTPESPIQRIKTAQICPHCFAQLYSMWGEDLRIRGRCPECKKRVFKFYTMMLSGREVGLYYVVSVAVVAIVYGLDWYINFLDNFG